jgi:hypothetical protein
MVTLTTQGKYNLSILNKIKEYPDYKKHLPVITNGIDTFSGYDDFYLASTDNKVSEIIFIQAILPLPGHIDNLDHVLVMLSPNDISITYNASYYNLNPTEIELVENTGIDIGVFFKTLLRTMECGCLNWGIPFRRYSLKTGHSLYAANIKSLDCSDDSIFTLYGDVFSPSTVRPMDNGAVLSAYDDIKSLYIPLMHLNTIGAQLGIYPDGLIESFNNLLHERKLFRFPVNWLTASERRAILMPPYVKGKIVYSRVSQKSFLNVINNNIDNPDEENNTSWKEINYSRPFDENSVSSLTENPLEVLLYLFNKSFDLSTLSPR